jgi:hypothetical protein
MYDLFKTGSYLKPLTAFMLHHALFFCPLAKMFDPLASCVVTVPVSRMTAGVNPKILRDIF